jgi:hypothetical protein
LIGSMAVRGRVVAAREPRVEERKWRRFMLVRRAVLAGLASGVQGWKWELACDRGIGDWGVLRGEWVRW